MQTRSRPMRLAVGIITWQDGAHMIDATVASLEGVADELLIADGAITGIDLQGIEPVSPPEWFPADAHLSAHVWESQSVKRTWLLEKARSLGCDWLLQIDADERIHDPAKLKRWLASWDYDAFPLPFAVDPGVLACASWKCIKVSAWKRIAAGGAFIEHQDGTVYLVVPPDGRPPAEGVGFLPWVSHHPEERLEGRRMIRLGELEEILEPPPLDAPPWISPSLEPTRVLASDPMAPPVANLDTWFCDQCGVHYTGPGVCQNGHPPADVKAANAAGPEPVTAEDSATFEPTGSSSSSTAPRKPRPPRKPAAKKSTPPAKSSSSSTAKPAKKKG